jgi:PAS domain S-box-containing protein
VLFESAFRDAAIGMALVGLDGRWLEVNDAVCAIVGYARAELLATTFQAITHPEDLEPDLELVNRLLSGEIRSYHLEKRYIHRDGRSVPIMLTVSLVRDESGKPAHFISQIQDFTAQRTAERNAQIFFEQSIDMLAIASAGMLERVNPAWERALGWSNAELVGRAFIDLVHPDDRPATQGESASVWAGGTSQGFRNRCRAKSGEYHWIEWNATPTSDGKLFCVARDVTQQVAALREKEFLLREVHHRVKNNLQVVSSLLSLQASQSTDKELSAALADAKYRVHSIALVHARLHESHAAGVVHFQSYANALLTNLLHAHDAGTRGITASILGGDLSLSIDTAVLCGLMISELVVNAIKHGFPDGRRGKIEVALFDRSPLLELVVADDGVGLSAATYFAERNSLGLELVKTFADQLHAEVTLSTEGGTRFSFAFRAEPRASLSE